MTVRVIYRERTFLDHFRCIDTERCVTLNMTWESGDLIYGYTDRFNTKCIAKDDIISMEVIS